MEWRIEALGGGRGKMGFSRVLMPASKAFGSPCIGRIGETDIMDFSMALDLVRVRRRNKNPKSASRSNRAIRPPRIAPTFAPVDMPDLVTECAKEGGEVDLK